MLGPPRENKNNKKKKKPSKTVRLVEPKQEESIAGSAASNRAIYHYQTSSPPLPPIPPHKLPSPSDSSINPETLFPQTLIVISFITRLPLKRNQGQGSVSHQNSTELIMHTSKQTHCFLSIISELKSYSINPRRPSTHPIPTTVHSNGQLDPTHTNAVHQSAHDNSLENLTVSQSMDQEPDRNGPSYLSMEGRSKK
jgi:hypothetical protein